MSCTSLFRTFLANLLALSNLSAAELPSPPAGWRVEVIAEAPRIHHPTVVCCAPDGRAFVAEDPMDISAPADASLGRILCFHPGGEVSVFAEGLHAIFGMQYLEGKLYVLHNPQYTRFDADGGVAGARVDLIASTNPNPWALDWNDHVPANFKLAMDGFFYVSVGDKGIYGAVGADGKRFDLHGGGVVRMRPDGTELEVFTTGTRNHLDVAVNASDDVFTYDNTDELDWWSRVAHMVEGGYYGYPWDHKPPQPFILPAITEYGAGAATAILSYDDDALPEEYRGDLWLCDWGRREVFRLKLERSGGTYRVAQRIDFIANAPADFRPVGMAFAPDGLTLYVTDWRHPDFKAQVDAGRLFKFTYTGPNQARPRPGWHLASALGGHSQAPLSDLLEALRHPSRDVRLTAQRELSRRGGEALADLARLASDEAAPPRARHHALWAIDAIEGASGLAHPAVAAALKSADVSVRAQATRILGQRRVRDAVPGLQGALFEADTNLRRLSACALGRIGDADSVPVLIQALFHHDLFERQAAWTAIHRIASAQPTAWPLVVQALLRPEERVREGAAFALRDAYDPAAVSALVDLVEKAPAPLEARAAALRLLASLHRKVPEWKGEWWAYHPVKLPRPVRTVEWEGTQAVLACLSRSLGDDRPLLRRTAASSLLEARETALLPAMRQAFEKESDGETRRTLLQALGGLKDSGSTALIVRLLDRAREDGGLFEDAVAAAEHIGGADLANALARSLVRRDVPAGLEARAIAALGRIGVADDAAAILPYLSDPSPTTRKASASALSSLKNPAALEGLLRAFAAADGGEKLEIATALTRLPDVRALEAYLLGLSLANATLRQSFHEAMRAIKEPALSRIEDLIRARTLDRQAWLELRRIYADPRPVKSWRLLGPQPRDTAPPAGAIERGEVSSWVEVEAQPDGVVDLDRTLAPGSKSVAWAHAEVTSSGVAYTEIFAGCRGASTIWLNGVKVYDSPVGGRIGENLDRIRVRFEAGRNRVLLRAEESGGGAGFILKVPVAAVGPLFAEDLREADPRSFLEFAMREKGDAARGLMLFRDTARAACTKCHAVKGEGGHVGPDLAGVGVQQDRAGLAESVLFPSKVVRPGYDQVTLVTSTGELIVGILRGETADSVTLVNAEGVERAIPKDDIAQREASPVSIMPEGVATGLSLKEFADLIAYLESLRGA